MHYWNKRNLEGLAQISAALAGDPQLGAVSRYCALRAKGLRKQALSEIHSFTASTKQWSTQARRDTVDRLLQVWHGHPGVHQLLPQPLVGDLVRPTLDEWARAEPESATAQRWLGMVSGDRSKMETALSLDPADDIARGWLITALLDDVDHATHHLVEGVFLGKESDAVDALRSAESLLAGASDHARFARFEGWLRQLRSLLNDWMTYRETPGGEFRDWCARRGREYDWPSIVYYDDGEGRASDARRGTGE